jgi:hypothetical protein
MSDEHQDQAPQDQGNAPAAPAPAPAGGDVKAEEGKDGAAKQVSLKVVNADGAEVYFKIKRSTQLRKLMDAYCKKQGIAPTSVRFLYDGAPIDQLKTPDDLEMDDDDVIDAMVEQTGGF